MWIFTVPVKVTLNISLINSPLISSKHTSLLLSDILLYIFICTKYFQRLHWKEMKKITVQDQNNVIANCNKLQQLKLWVMRIKYTQPITQNRVTITVGVWETEFHITLSPPNISIHILHTLFYTFPLVLTRRICFTIKAS